jgi:hypothetical protein
MRYFSCLLVGQPGSGKTTAAATATAFGPVLFLDMDNKLHKMENVKDKLDSGSIIQWSVAEPLSKGIKLSQLAQFDPKPGSKQVTMRPEGYIKLADMIDKLAESKCIIDHGGKKVKVETVVLDSYTSMGEHLKRLLMSVNQTTTMTMPLYGTALTNYETLNNTLLNLPANIIIIAHQKANKDEITGEISFTPLVDGQMADKIGKDFEEVYYLEKKITGDSAKFEMLTLGTNLKPCRTSRALPARVEPDFGKIYKMDK